MYPKLQADQENQAAILDTAVTAATQFLRELSHRPAAVTPKPHNITDLPADGRGAADALTQFQARYGAEMAGSAGPRYFGFVTGGSTPAALIGDWLTAVYDQNPATHEDSAAPQVERETIHFLRQLLGLPDDFTGTFVSGATMSNFVGLAQGRQWAAQQQGIDVAEDGLYRLSRIPVLAATPHASSYKSLSMLGLGRQNMTRLPTLTGREAMDVSALAQQLAVLDEPALVIASGGTVNTVDFDDLQAIAALKQDYPFWLHVDAAFGGFAACSPRYAHLLDGWEQADSITVDAHKWLNVPYDSAMTFSRHPDLQVAVFQNTAVYLGPTHDTPAPVHWTPQNSRRFRALPAWMTLLAYGRNGYREIIERNCAQAQWLGRQIEASPQFRLLAPVRLNGVCFTLAGDPTLAEIHDFLARLRDDGRVFLTPTQYKDTPAIRASISNWQTTQADLAICWQALQEITFALERNVGNSWLGGLRP